MPYRVHGKPLTRMRARCPGWTRPITLAGAKSATSSSPVSGVTTATVTQLPARETVVLVPGATTVAMGPATTTTSGASVTTVTRYWANVPATVTSDADFQRWQRLK